MPHLTTADGYRLNYAQHGEGEPPHFVHPGLLTNIDRAAVFLAPLAERNRTVVYDHIGAAGSDRPEPDERSYSTERHLEDALELADHLGLTNRISTGWARGSATAARHALARPAEVQAVVMLGPPLVRDLVDEHPVEVASAFRELSTKGQGLAPKAFVDAGLPDATEEQKELALSLLDGTTTADILGAQIEADFGSVTLAEAGALECPTLIVWGTGDILVSEEHVRALAEAIPDSRLVEVDGAGNGLFFTRPQETFGAVAEFLA